jgi:phosphatidylglycerophosphatase C
MKTGLKKQPWRILFILLFSPFLLSTVAFKLEKTFAKSLLLWSITAFRGKKGVLRFFNKTMSDVADKIWFREAIEQFNSLKNEKIEIVIVSASGQCWIRALLRSKFKNCKLIIGSKLCFFLGGVILKSKNCYKDEKITRIESILGKNIIWHSAWSDHTADLPMLKKSKQRYIICPKKNHLKVFQQELNNNFTLLNWTTNNKNNLN